MKRKGVTPVIAIILLLLIVVVMIGGVFAWMSVMQEDVEEATREGVLEFIEEAERNVEVVTYSCDTGEVYLYNGVSDNFDVSLYIDGENRGSTTIDLGEENVGEGEVLDDGDVDEGNRFEVSHQGHVVERETFRC